MNNSATNFNCLVDQSSDFLLKANLLNVLNTIASEVKLKSDFTVTHPQLGTFSLIDKIDWQFQQLSLQTQQQYFCVKLQTLLHDIYYRQSKLEKQEIQEENILENQAIKWKKSKFYQELEKNNFGQGYFDPDWLIIGEEKNELLPIKKNDLTLHISPLRHLQSWDRNKKIGELVAVKMPANLVEQRFYVAVGDGGTIDYQKSDSKFVNLYFHVNAKGAVSLMAGLTEKINQIKIPFNFKVLYNADDYPLEDAAILTIASQHYEMIRPILQDIYLANYAFFNPEIPLFTKFLAPGLSLAEQANQANSSIKNFGLHYFEAIAKGLITAWQQGEDIIQNKVRLIRDFLAEQQINFNYPYLNLNSEDIYQFSI